MVEPRGGDSVATLLRRFGDAATLQACLLDPACVEANELERWCSAQTETLCGTDEACYRPLQPAALERAKANLRREFALVGALRSPYGESIRRARRPKACSGRGPGCLRADWSVPAWA